MDEQRSAELILLIICLLGSMSVAAAFDIARPGCKDTCGNVKIAYPFGIGPECAYSSWYEVVCDASFSPPKPMLQKLNFQVINIQSRRGRVSVHMQPQKICKLGGTNEADDESVKDVNLGGTPFSFTRGNKLVVEGCTASVTLMNSSKQVLVGCASICPHQDHNATARIDCAVGVGCCQSSLVGSLYSYRVSFADDTKVDPPTCVNTSLISNTQVFRGFSSANTLRTILAWSIEKLPNPLSEYHYSDCYFGSGNLPVECECTNNSDIVGNPYLPTGCAAPKGCEGCKAKCTQIDDTKYTCKKRLPVSLADITGPSAGIGTILLVIGSYWLYKVVKRWKEIQHKAKNFKRNGGLLLQRELSSEEGVVDKLKIFTMNELEKATDDFNENRIVGEGGQGTVYKGMLMDGQIVAVKKSKQIDESQLELFANEMIILSRINQRNVVEVLGCCLETDVPMLVYEFIPNGSLYQHIHHPEDGFYVTWKMRMQIAAETAEALAYLHSSSSTPIFHRDIKTSNILLDDKFRAKVSDFGSSRTITIEQTHLTTTAVQGTFGYLDPEYFQSNQFTEKSDVYSFGVVLVELLTSKKPVHATEGTEWRSLIREFLVLMENSGLFKILDNQMLEDGNEKDLLDVATLAKWCLNLNGKLRPTMREVAIMLERVRSCHIPELKDQGIPDSEIEINSFNDEIDDYASVSIPFPWGGQSPCSTATEPLFLKTI
ncbi:Wall-associated receptor kinase-like 8-like protein [Drosera capensis]